MAAEVNRPVSQEPSLEEEVIQGVLSRPHEQKLAGLTGDFAAFARGTIHKRLGLSRQGVSPEDAYSQAVADLGTYLASLAAARASIAELETFELPPVA